MPLTPGEKLGPYEILSPIGAGGMGEVYKARDTWLDRLVAVKVLPGHIAKRDDIRARFEREARAVAGLNHPHICVLHDIGPGYMVMEFIEGETLAERIEKGAIPLAQAVKLAVQIADALDRAHRAGVTHRDVKPQNIMLTRDGVKVLDFGLAKSTAAPGPADVTLTKGLTTEGTILGTPQYMAPEQFEGKEADARSDIWAFGAVLYEMVTGKKAFQGKSYSSLLGAILSAEPGPMSPAWLERVARRCLHKDPERRYQSMRDIQLDLEAPPAEIAKPVTSRLPWAIAAVCLVIAAIAATAFLRNPGQSAQPVKFEINPPEGGRLPAIGSAISPDGRTLAYNAYDGKATLLHLRNLASLDTRPLPGTENALRPFWSPDGKSLAFGDVRKLKRIDMAGGSAVTICDTCSFARGGTWNEQGVILYGQSTAGLQRVSALGGTPAPVTHLNRETGETSHMYPQFLPGGKQFVYAATYGDGEQTGILIGSLDGKPSVRILESSHNAVYDPAAGRLLYIQENGALVSKRLELDPPRLTGDAVVAAERDGFAFPNGFANVSVSNNGTLLYGRAQASPKRRVVWMDRAGKVLDTIEPPLPEDVLGFALSPDNSRIAYSKLDRQAPNVWVLDLARGAINRVTVDGGYYPIWTPDGKHLYYSTFSGIQRRSADGFGEAESIWKGSDSRSLWSVSPDGRHMLIARGGIQVLALTGSGKPEPYVQTKFIESGAVFSPDGRWVAYSSNETGRSEIYIQGFPDHRGKWLASSAGGFYPRWRADGKELYWTAPGFTIMAASVELKGAEVRVGRAELLSKSNGLMHIPARDGRRFLAIENDSELRPVRPMVVIQNWAAGMGR